jgi:hypothetical protein
MGRFLPDAKAATTPVWRPPFCYANPSPEHSDRGAVIACQTDRGSDRSHVEARQAMPEWLAGVGQGLARWYAPAKTLTFYSAICFVHTKIILLGTERIY